MARKQTRSQLLLLLAKSVSIVFLGREERNWHDKVLQMMLIAQSRRR